MFGWFKKFTSPTLLRAKGVLGMNARNFHVISKYNARRLYPLVDDKVQTKAKVAKATPITEMAEIILIAWCDFLENK